MNTVRLKRSLLVGAVVVFGFPVRLTGHNPVVSHYLLKERKRGLDDP